MSEPLLHWIDGEPTASADGATRTGTDPSTGAPGATISLGTAADVDRAVQAAHRARTAWRHTGLARPRPHPRRDQPPAAGRPRRLAAMESADTGKPLALSHSRDPRRRRVLRVLRRPGQPAGRAGARHPAQPARLHAARAARGGRRHHPVEPAAQPGRPGVRPGPGGGQHGGGQAGRGHLPHDRRARQDRHRGRAAAGRLQRRPRPRARGRHRDRRAPPRPQGRVHRVGPGRPGDRPHRRRPHPPADPRTRRQVGQHRLRRRRPGLRRDRGGPRLRHQRRPGLLVRHPPAGAARRAGALRPSGRSRHQPAAGQAATSAR